jgi:hypothetical protein
MDEGALALPFSGGGSHDGTAGAPGATGRSPPGATSPIRSPARHLPFQQPSDGLRGIQPQRSLGQAPGILVSPGTYPLLDRRDGRRGHAQFIHAQAQKQGRSQIVSGKFTTHSNPDASAVADFFRVSPWEAEEIYRALGSFVIADMLRRAEEEGAEPIIWASIDDSATRKDKETHALEAVDWIFDHSASGKGQTAYCKGAVQDVGLKHLKENLQ